MDLGDIGHNVQKWLIIWGTCLEKRWARVSEALSIGNWGCSTPLKTRPRLSTRALRNSRAVTIYSHNAFHLWRLWFKSISIPQEFSKLHFFVPLWNKIFWSFGIFYGTRIPVSGQLQITHLNNTDLPDAFLSEFSSLLSDHSCPLCACEKILLDTESNIRVQHRKQKWEKWWTMGAVNRGHGLLLTRGEADAIMVKAEVSKAMSTLQN